MKIKKNRTHSALVTCSLLILFLSYASIALAGEATLSWNANNETDLAGYKIYYGTSSGQYGTPIDVGNKTTHNLTGLSKGELFFAVTAYDTSGNQSGFSTEVSKTLGESDASQFGNSSPASGGCGFTQGSNNSQPPGVDLAFFLVPLLLGARMFWKFSRNFMSSLMYR